VLRRSSVLLLAWLVTGCSHPVTVKIISSLPMHGPLAAQSRTMVAAIQMALDEAGGRAGRCSVRYEAWDDGDGAGDWHEEEANARRAAADPAVMVVVGPYNSGAAKLSIPILNQAGLVMVSPACTYPGLTQAGPEVEQDEPGRYYPSGIRTFCRLVPTDRVQGEGGAAWAKSMHAHRVYVLHSPDRFGITLAGIFSRACRARGLTVLADDPLSDASVDRIRDAHADLIYFGGTTANGIAPLVVSLRHAGVQATFMGPGGIRDNAFLEEAGPAAEGVCSTLGALPLEELPASAKEWYDRYVSRYGSPPDAYTIYAYEAAGMALRGIAAAGRVDRAAIRQAIMATHDYHGVLGTWSLDADGDTSLHALSAYRVERHEFRFLKLLSP
jgi:branched-chain amino acid transport system substrate-binding protein